MIWLNVILFALFGYLCGSLTFALWITQAMKGVDVRTVGSGHATATNTIRQAGWGAGILVFIFDTAKGFIPTFLALKSGPVFWIAAIAAGAAVIGHCWPLFGNFRGGMGLATGGGGILACSPPGFLVGLGLLVGLLLLIRHAARASALAGLLVSPVLWLLGFGEQATLIAAAAGAIVAFRFLADWSRKYRELWLDRP